MRPRGRPKNSDIEILIIQGSEEQSEIKCPLCNRIFVRHKNLNAHIAAHKAEKKYGCDFPRCADRFVQSSQLKAHKYTHTKEKPFKCPADGCMFRGRHSNRICNSHANLKLIKQPQDAEEIRFNFYRNIENLSESQKIWFEEYMVERERKQQTAPRKRKIDVDDLQEIHKDTEKKVCRQDNIQQQIEWEKILSFGEQVALFYWFVIHVRGKGLNSLALFKKCCNLKK